MEKLIGMTQAEAEAFVQHHGLACRFLLTGSQDLRKQDCGKRDNNQDNHQHDESPSISPSIVRVIAAQQQEDVITAVLATFPMYKS